jgi:DNA-binding NtrC family response regulator
VFPRRLAVLCSQSDVVRRIADALPEWQVSDWRSGQAAADARPVDAAVLECSSCGDDPGLALARLIRERNPQARIVFIALEGSEDLAIEALRIGAVDYLKPPLDTACLVRALDRDRIPAPLLQSAPELRSGGAHAAGAIVGESSGIRQVKSFLLKVAASGSNVLITGETGTGKEMIAEHIHRLGPRARKRFVCVNCSAIPDSLVESELFGHEKGAFTGAVAGRDGKLVEADGGTLFFDEIGDMSPLAQAKVLRAIESREFSRLGGNRTIRVDVRLVAATNRHLESLLREDRFRADLFFRLNVARIEMPSLRERPSDIPLLVHHFVAHYNRVFGAAVQRIAGEALEAMLAYPWPGNVRELKNVVEMIFLNLSPGETVVERLPEQVLGTWRKLNDLPRNERENLIRTLLATDWNVSAAARKLEWSRMTMYRKLAKHNIRPERGAPANTRSHAG